MRTLFFSLLGMCLSVRGAAAEVEPSLRVMTYNVNFANPDVRRTLDAIAAEDADVVLLQEIDEAWKKALQKRFEKAYPHRRFHLHARSPGGLGVLSKHPINVEDILPAPSGWFPASRLLIAAPFGVLQILNVHLRPAIDRGSWIRGYLTTPSIRLAEIQAYTPKLAPKVPTIIAGDFNEAPEGEAMAFLGSLGFVRAATTGPTTWHYELLEIDLDHVLLDGSLVAKDGVVRDAGASDHRPVVVTVQPK
ncbi:MAG: endonuclease/exonuclease/phosphatase family protein [Kofleriaceae bacterium]|nr:endonuclease/exonuclease/phosphatase family protein [Kofleriaceae bacterium]